MIGQLDDGGKGSFHLIVKVVEITVVLENKVCHLHAAPHILVVGICRGHLAALIFKKSLEGDMIGFGIAGDDTLIANFGVCIDRKEQKMLIFAQRLHLTGCANALNDGVAAVGFRLLVQLIGNKRRRVLGPQVIGHLHESVSVDFQATALGLFDKVTTHRIVLKTVMLNEIIHDSALACA